MRIVKQGIVHMRLSVVALSLIFLISFCHKNPVDEGGGEPEPPMLPCYFVEKPPRCLKSPVRRISLVRIISQRYY